MERGRGRERERGELGWRTFLDLGFLHLVVDGLLEVSFVTVRQPVNVDLRLSLIHRYCVWKQILGKGGILVPGI